MNPKYDFPKIELHLHLDGSYRVETMCRLAKERGIAMPGDTPEGCRAWLAARRNARSVNKYLEMFDPGTEVLQDKEALTTITRELIADLDAEGTVYAEIRFAPQLHTKKGLSQADAVEAVLEGKRQGLAEHPNIQIGILVCMMCVGPETANWDANMETVEIAHAWKDKGIAGLDLAGAEGIVPLSHFGPLFAKARAYGLNMTCHAGDSQGPDTVQDAMNFGVTRIGHGHHIFFDKDLCLRAIKNHVTLEVCPTSNVQCMTVPSYRQHPLVQLYTMGVPVTISTDNMTMSGVGLEDEYDHCLQDMGFTPEALLHMNLNAINAAFLPEDKKVPIRRQLQDLLAQQENSR
jgi:adenosine deaminase